MAVNAGELTTIKIATVACPGVITVDGPEITTAKVDTTSIGAAGAKTSRPSKKYEVGPISLQVLWDSKDATHDALYDHSVAGTTFAYEEVYEDGAKFGATVFVASISFSGSEDEGNVVADITLEHTGAVTYTPASGGT